MTRHRVTPLGEAARAVVLISLLTSLCLCLTGCFQDKVERSIAALEHDSVNVRTEAAQELGNIGDARAVEPLLNALRDEDDVVRQRADRSLCRIADANAVETLIAALDDENPFVQEGAAHALGCVGDARAVEPLIAVLTDVSWAMWALGEIGDPRAVEPLIAALGHQYFGVRHGAAQALGHIGDARAVEPLIAVLGDENKWVREKVAEALDNIGTPAVEALIAALDDENEDTQEQATWALCEMDNTYATERLMDAVAQEQLDIVAKAHRCYIQLGAPGTETALIRALDEYGTVSMATDFLNCGNDRLAEAAYEWGKKRGLEVTGMPGLGRELMWGSGQ